MSIKVDFYSNYSKKTNSTKLPVLADTFTEYDCVLKEGFTFTQPEIEIYISGNPEAYNYAYIPAFERYYFIKDWTYFHGTWTASMLVDVLASYKTQIGNMTRYINRSSHDSNGDLIDTAYPTTAEAHVAYTVAENPFDDATGSYIIGLIGASQPNVPNLGGVNYYYMSDANMAEFLDYLLSPTFSSLLKDDANGYSDKIVKSLVNPTDYITSCIWFPFDIDPSTSVRVQPLLGWWDNITPLPGDPGFPDTAGCKALGGGATNSLKFSVPITVNTISMSDHSQISRGRYLNCAPYSTYVFHLDPWGDIELDGSKLLGVNTLTYSIQCEGLTGAAVLEIFAGSRLITRQFAQVGVPVSVAQIISQIETMGSVGGAVKTAGGIFSALKNADWKTILKGWTWKTADRAAARKAIQQIGKDVVSGIDAGISDVDIRGVNGSIISYTGTYNATLTMYTQGAYLKTTRYNLVAEDLSEMGRPLCAMKQISTIPGYIECATGDIEIACLEEEKDMIAGYMTGGFFYE